MPALHLLGQRIRTYRTRQRQLHVDRPWAQEDLAVAIGSDKAHVNRIECGRQRPTLDTLNRVADALGLAWADRSRLLHLAGYLLAPPTPRLGEITEVARSVSGILHATPYPANLADHEGRIWDANNLFAGAFLDYPSRDRCLADIRGRRMIELLCDGHRAGAFLRGTLEQYSAFARRHLLALQRSLQQHPASTELRDVLDAVLADRQLCAIWLAMSAHLPHVETPDYLDHQHLHLEHPGVGRYRVQVWESTLAADDRFQVVHLVPADDRTRARFAELTERGVRSRPAGSIRPRAGVQHRDGAIPDRPVMLTVPWAAGGATDVGARILAPLVAEEIGREVVVVNRDDAQSPRILDELARQPSDGCHLAVINQPALGAALLRGGRDLGAHPFTLVVNHAFDPMGAFVRDDNAYRSIRDLVRDATRRPGGVTVGTSGAYTPAHLAALLLQRAAGIRFRFIHYRGSMEHIARFLAGQTDVAFFGAGIAVAAVRAGDLRALAMFTEERFPLVAEVPTAAESGFDGLVLASTRGIWAPPRIPPTALRTLEAAFVAAQDRPAHLRQMHAAGLGVKPLTGREYAELIGRQHRLCAELLTRSHTVGGQTTA